MAVAGRVVVWINAFIPRDVPGYTVNIVRGENAGKTAVPLPGAARLPVPIMNNMIKPLDTGYLTDQRSFSSNANASVRMQSQITISLPDGHVSGVHQTSGTTEVNMKTGETRDNADADMSDCRHSAPYALPYSVAQLLYEQRNSLTARQSMFLVFKATTTAKPWIWNPSETQYAMAVNVKGAASDPCVRWAADIDYEVVFVVGVDREAGTVITTCLGLIDEFPAYEAYAKYLGETQTLFTVPPPPGNTVVNLLGSANRPVLGVTMFGSPVCRAPTPLDPNILNYFQ